MKTRVRKWGHNLAVRIPRPYAAEAGLAPGTPVAISLVDGKLVVEPLAKREFALEELLAQITADNLHGENDTGHAVGNERWQ